jgi:prepilin-type N-terminal cleavage/methylation domain-containing protein
VASPAFTIVELLVVIVVIGILAAITIVAYTGISSKATVASLQSDLSNAKKQLALYQVDYGIYPTANVCPAVLSTDICLKTSSDTTFTYSSNNSNTIKTFNLLASKGSANYTITNDSQPSVFIAIPAASISATGAYTLSTDGRYNIYKFTGNGTITTTVPGTAEVLVVGGGGGGSGGGGGGGGGGYLNIQNYALSGTVNIIVGNGGIRDNGNPGGDSILGIYTAKGGGRGGGGANANTGGIGGSGGGGGSSNSVTTIGGNATSGQGNNGGGNAGYIASTYPGGGGGGAGGSGGNAVNATTGGTGGLGISSNIVFRGNNVSYSNGGKGGNDQNGGAITGLANTGDGGGGDGWNGAAGGSGIVVVRYLTP